MDAEFVRNIEDPEPLPLQRMQASAEEVVEDRLDSYDMVDVPDWVIRKLSYTYYHDWTTDEPEYVFLLADPGVPGEHVVLELNAYADLGEGYDPLEAVQIDRRFGSRWLATRRYTDFTSEFIDCCERAGLISPREPWWRYLLSGGFFDDFYMADAIKYRGVSPNRGELETAFSSHLIHELEYVEASVIFAFGKRAWDTLREHLRPTPLDGGVSGSGIADVHGVVHETGRLLETMVVPLGHPSTNFRGAQLSHEEYMRRAEAAIQQVAERIAAT